MTPPLPPMTRSLADPPEPDVEPITLDVLEGIAAGNGHPPSTDPEQRGTGLAVTYETGRSGATKLKLPPVPAPDDTTALAEWLTVAFSLNPAHPIIAAAHQGLRGAAGHVELTRRGAPPIRFEPVSRINTPARLIEDLSWQVEPNDGAILGYKGEHTHLIAHVIRMLAGATKAISDTEETMSLLGAFLQAAVPVEGLTTYGTGEQRYEAARGLQGPLDERYGPTGAVRYLVDSNTGEVVVRVGDLSAFARRSLGSGLARGWLDGRLDGLGWARVRLDGHEQPGRPGRTGPHARIDVYRGLLADPPVTT